MVDRLNMLMESRIHGDVYVRFGGEFSETYHRNMIRRWVLSLRLTAQYLFIFVGGLLGVFILFVVLYLIGISTLICIIIGVSIAVTLVFNVFRMNEKYGQYGLMKTLATKRHPHFIINRRAIINLFPKH